MSKLKQIIAPISVSVGISLLAACKKEPSAHSQSQEASPAPSRPPAAPSPVLEKITKIISEQLGVPPGKVTRESNPVKDLGADSLDAVELIMALEEEFNISIDDASAEKMRTVGDIESYILLGAARK